MNQLSRWMRIVGGLYVVNGGRSRRSGPDFKTPVSVSSRASVSSDSEPGQA